MRRTIVVMVMLGLLAASLAMPAEAAKKKKKKKKPAPIERVVEHNYDRPSPGVPGVASACFAAFDEAAGCVNIPLAAGEAFVNVDVTDTSGQTPYFILAQDTDPSNAAFEIFASFCGKTGEAVPITAGLELRISVYAFGGPECPNFGTSGTIKATLTSAP